MARVDLYNDAYPAWGKTERLGKRYMTITEKIDGSNGLVYVCPVDETFTSIVDKHWHAEVGDVAVLAGSRTRWLKPDGKDDNFGFCRWVADHAEELVKLGAGAHYGEWWGSGIQRRYALEEKRFSLFNTTHPAETLPECVHQVPVLYHGGVDFAEISQQMDLLRAEGSRAAPGFMNPEGVIVWVGRERYKHTFEPK